MKVYVLFESSGDYEDYREYIHSIYLDKDKCESVKNELEKSDKEYMEQIHKCNRCICGCGYVNNKDCDSCEKEEDDCLQCQLEEVRKYCDKASCIEIHESVDGWKELYCNERECSYSDGYNYRIEEKEVIE